MTHINITYKLFTPYKSTAYVEQNQKMADQQPESLMLTIKLHYISLLEFISDQLAVLDQQADQS